MKKAILFGTAAAILLSNGVTAQVSVVPPTPAGAAAMISTGPQTTAAARAAAATAAGVANSPCPPGTQVRAGSNTISEPPANSAVGINIDRYIGNPDKNPTAIYRNAMMQHPILTQGDSQFAHPGHDGAVLRYHHDISLDVMMPGEETDLEAAEEAQQLIYVESGQARLDDGNLAWDLKEGLMALIPGGHKTRFTNTGDKPFTMLVQTDLPHPEVTPIPDIVVRDPAKVEYVEQGVHWANLSKGVYNDYGVRFLIVYMAPMSIAGPHSHDVPTEEGWVKISDGTALMNMGSELRPWPKNVGMIAPNTCQTVHGAINNTDQIQAWFYFAATGAPARLPGAAGGGGGNGGRGGGAATASAPTAAGGARGAAAPAAAGAQAPAAGAAPAAGRGGAGAAAAPGNNAAAARNASINNSMTRSTIPGRPLTAAARR